MTARDRRWLTTVVVLAVGIRLLLAGAAVLWGANAQAFHVPDSARYLTLAQSIVEDGGFRFGGEPELFRLPGFPLLVAIGVAAGAPTAVTVVLHAALGGLTTWLCFIVGRHAGGTRTGLWTATLYAIEPGQWAWSNLLVTETLFTALLATSLAATATYLSTRRGVWLIAGVGVAALSAYVRLVGYVLPLALLAGVAWIGYRSLAARQRPALGRHLAAGLAIAVFALGAWHVRNGLVSGYWGFSMQVDRAAYLMGGGTVGARSTGSSYVGAVGAMGGGGGESGLATVDGLSPGEMRSRGTRAILTHPWVFGSTYLTGVGTTLVHPGTAAFMRPFAGDTGAWDGGQPSAGQMVTLGQWEGVRSILAAKSLPHLVLSAVLTVVAVVYLALAVTGLSTGRKRPPALLAGIVMACLLLASGGPDGDSRRRAPMIPMMCVLAAVAITQSDRLKTREPAQ